MLHCRALIQRVHGSGLLQYGEEEDMPMTACQLCLLPAKHRTLRFLPFNGTHCATHNTLLQQVRLLRCNRRAQDLGGMAMFVACMVLMCPRRCCKDQSRVEGLLLTL